MYQREIMPPSSASLEPRFPEPYSVLHTAYERPDLDTPVIPIAHYLWLLRRAWWKIALFTCVCTALAGLLAWTMQPVYEATALIAVDPEVSSSVIGERAVTSVAGADADQFFNTELQLLQSDAVLRPVAEKFGLLLKSPKNMPAGMSAAEAPVSLPGLSVVHPANSFLINVSYRSHNPREAATVANAVTRSFSLHKRAMRTDASLEQFDFIKSQMADLKQKMDDSATALAAYEKQLGVINPDEKTSILETRLQQLNNDYTQAQNDRIQKQVDLQALRTGSGAALEVSPQASELSKLAENVRTAQEKMDAIKQIYGSANAEYKHAASALAEAQRQYTAAQGAVGKRIEMQYAEAKHREELISAALLQTKGQFDSLNARSIQYQELKREAESNKTLYAELFRKVQETRLNAAFQGSPIRIADEARPQWRPVFPNKKIFLTLGFFLSLVGSLLAVLLADVVDKSLRDPQQTRRELGVSVMGILPEVQNARELSPLRTRTGEALSVLVKGQSWFRSRAFYEEAVGALLATIRVSRLHRQFRSILVTSPTQGEGKSTCIAHLAVAHARQGHRTLLIDADLRCPTQHRHFGLELGKGLADAAFGRRSLHEIVQFVPGNPQLDLVTAGRGDRQSLERVGNAVDDLLKSAYQKYDLVLIDAPPMVGFAEPIRLAASADGVLVICHAGRTSKQEVTGVLTTLEHIGKRPLGLVLNQVRETMSAHYGTYQQGYARRVDPAA